MNFTLKKMDNISYVPRLQPRIKISVITDISVVQFYGYIEYIGDISTNILTQNIDWPKIDQNL